MSPRPLATRVLSALAVAVALAAAASPALAQGKGNKHAD